MRRWRYRVRDGEMEKQMFIVASESEIPEDWKTGEFEAAQAATEAARLSSRVADDADRTAGAPAASNTVKRGPGRPRKLVDAE